MTNASLIQNKHTGKQKVHDIYRNMIRMDHCPLMELKRRSVTLNEVVISDQPMEIISGP